jgi:hypothetical protein
LADICRRAQQCISCKVRGPVLRQAEDVFQRCAWVCTDALKEDFIAHTGQSGLYCCTSASVGVSAGQSHVLQIQHTFGAVATSIPAAGLGPGPCCAHT